MKQKIKLEKFSKGLKLPKFQKKTKFIFKSKNQYGEFTTNKKIGTPTENETISPSEVLKIKKLLKNYSGLKIFEYETCRIFKLSKLQTFQTFKL